MISIEEFNKRCVPVPWTGCWLWLGHVKSTGYGECGTGKTRQGAHRVSYRLYRGPISPELQIDHLCRVRSCVNPKHLELVTIRENVLRGWGRAGVNARKLICKRGHSLVGDNARINKYGHRNCRICRANLQRRSRAITRKGKVEL